MTEDTYVYIMDFEDGSVRYGITKNIAQRINAHIKTFGETFVLSLMVDKPVKEETAKTIEALLIQQAFDNNIKCKNYHVENKRYLFKHKDKLETCPICEEIGCAITPGYIDKLIEEHNNKIKESKKRYNRSDWKSIKNKEWRDAHPGFMAAYCKQWTKDLKKKQRQERIERYLNGDRKFLDPEQLERLKIPEKTKQTTLI